VPRAPALALRPLALRSDAGAGQVRLHPGADAMVGIATAFRGGEAVCRGFSRSGHSCLQRILALSAVNPTIRSESGSRLRFPEKRPRGVAAAATPRRDPLILRRQRLAPMAARVAPVDAYEAPEAQQEPAIDKPIPAQPPMEVWPPEFVARKRQLGEQTVTLDSGRRLTYFSDGDPSGQAVLCIHGVGQSKLLFAQREPLPGGIRMIAVDRFGYGGSSPSQA
jgi:hypothetical protein